MTNKEAAEIILNYDAYGCGYCHQGGDEVPKAFGMAAKALLNAQEPVYPTWGDWLAEMGLICWEDNGDGVYSVMVPTFKMCTQIPADIAQKLGIEPKEGT